jgi:hypothetical protein
MSRVAYDGPMAARDERIAKNETLWREVNERIRDVTKYNGDIEFLCECGDPTCAQPISMAIPEYEAIRADATHFLVVPGHVIPDVENVVGGNERYTVVAKRAGEPAAIAFESDPRS